MLELNLAIVTILLTFHPLCDSGTSMFLEGSAEGDIAVETALLGKHDGCRGWHRVFILMIQADEVLDAQTIDIGIIGDRHMSQEP